MAWAFAKLCVVDLPLRDSISASALPKLAEFMERQLTQTAWALSTLSVCHMTLLASLAS